MHKTVGYSEIEKYHFSDCHEITGDELYRINGGKQVENSNEGVASAQPGDTIIRDDKTEFTLTQGNIDWAQAHTGNGNTTTQTSSDSINNIPSSNSTGTQSITSETSAQVFTPQFTPGQIANYKMYNENQIASSDAVRIGVGSFIEGHLRLGGTRTYSIRERDK